MAVLLTHIRRTTTWCDDRGNVIQVAVAILDELWEPYAEATERVGPFDDPKASETTASDWALAAAERAGLGQLQLPEV